MLCESFFDSRLVGRQGPIIQLQRPPNQNLPLFEGKSWEFGDYFVETHGESLAAIGDFSKV